MLLAGAVSVADAAPSRARGAASVDPTALPLGDGHVSTSPKVGDVDSCTTSFGGGGPQTTGPWLNSSAKTWNSTTKVAVQGAVSWPDASYSATAGGGTRTITTNDLPLGHTSGTFPIGSSDPARAYDQNPNRITAQSITWSLPANPKAARSPACTPGGPIGVLSDGVLLYNALDGNGHDAPAHEVLDSCGGHPQMSGQYHHHTVPSCILSTATARSTLVGFAADGYGIYVERDAHGNLLTNTDLDACHGRTSTVVWNGKRQRVFHYDATLEYPYTIGCFRGSPISTRSGGQSGGGANGGPQGGGGAGGPRGGPGGGGGPGGPPPS